MRVVHYINQFFAGIGGEDHAGLPPERREGPVGPGRRLDALLGEGHDVVATVVCGDDHASSAEDAPARILELAREAGAEMLVAGPAFTSGRYGIACARVAAAAAAAGIPTLAAMHPDNPGVEELGEARAVATGSTARAMGEAVERMAAAARAMAAGEPIDPSLELRRTAARRNRLVEDSSARRAVALVLRRLGGDRAATEIPLTGFGRVTPAPPIDDPATAVVALVSEGGLVPAGNPDRLESARATRWLRYELDGRDALAPGEFQSVHGGFSTVAANEDPHRILPLDAARQLEREGRIGRLHPEYLVTTGNGTSVSDATRFGVEWAAELRRAGVQAAILTAT